MLAAVANARADEAEKASGSAVEEKTAAIVKQAEDRLARPLVTVMGKQLTPPSGDRHDYYAPAPYHWPNPRSADGLPYVLRDGQVNPDANTPKYDRVAYFRFGDTVTTLSVAYAITGDQRFAARAAEWLRAWCLDPATRMNPNLEYAQCVPGVAKGLPIGLIRAMTILDLARCDRLLAGSAAWSTDDHAAFAKWLAEFRRWFVDSELGHAEARAVNNHGTWHDAVSAALALYLGDRAAAREVVERAKATRIARQIAPDGRQPLEMLRTKSWDYAVMNLEAMVTLADVGRAVEVDLWGYQTDDGRSIRGALDYLLPFATGEKSWPAKQIKDFEPERLLPLVERAASALPDSPYPAALAKIKGPSAETRLRSRLLSVPLTRGEPSVEKSIGR